MPPDEPPELPILYRDEALLIVDKPAGLIVHRGWANDRVTALDLARRLAGQRVYPAHRLDRGTSGVLVFGLSSDVARELERAFSEDRVKKRYLALVRGTAPEALRIDHPIAKEKGKAKLPSVTHVARLERYEVTSDVTCTPRSYSWVEARPCTGRPHQIRRHLKHISHPIVGDVRYGKAEHNHLFRRRFGLERLVLHAECLTLPHPLRALELSVHAPLPFDLARLLESLRAATFLRSSGVQASGAGLSCASTEAQAELTGGAAARGSDALGAPDTVEPARKT